MRTARAGTIYDNLRIEVGRNGALKSTTPQSERPAAANSFYAGRDTSGIGQASTTARSSRTYTAGDLQPQGYFRAPAEFSDIASDAGKLANKPSTLPNRGVSPKGSGQDDDDHRGTSDRRRRTTPLAKRR